MATAGQFVFEPVGTHTRNASIDTAVALTPPAGADAVRLAPETQNVRYTTDGSTTATATVGFQLVAGDEDIVPVVAGKNVSIISETAGAVINYQWLRIRRADNQ